MHLTKTYDNLEMLHVGIQQSDTLMGSLFDLEPTNINNSFVGEHQCLAFPHADTF